MARQLKTKRWQLHLTWREQPKRTIKSVVEPKEMLTKPGMENHGGEHRQLYEGVLKSIV